MSTVTKNIGMNGLEGFVIKIEARILKGAPRASLVWQTRPSKSPETGLKLVSTLRVVPGTFFETPTSKCFIKTDSACFYKK